MTSEVYLPHPLLKNCVKYFVVSESDLEREYKVLPVTGMVMGFQYKGRLSSITDRSVDLLSSAGITGLTDTFKIFSNTQDTGTVLVYLTETGFSHFSAMPANELFTLSLSLSEIFNKQSIIDTQDQLLMADSNRQRVDVVEQFLMSQLKFSSIDKLVTEAVKFIYKSKGTIRIKDLHDKLCTSASPMEKRFRKLVGTSPKKFASVVRFNTILEMLPSGSVSDIYDEIDFFDQSHFIRDFKQYTGMSPENFKRSM